MADTNTPTPAPEPGKKTKKRVYGDIDKEAVTNIKLAEDVCEAASDEDNVAPLQAEEVTPKVVAGLLSRCDAARKLATKVVETKKAKETTTRDEEKSFEALMPLVRDAQGRAKRKFEGNKEKLAAYRIGKNNLGHNREEFEQDADTIVTLAGQDALPGMTPEKLVSLAAALKTWKDADAAQKRAEKIQTAAIDALETAVAEINTIRRDIQRAADLIWPYTVKANAATRRTFGLPPDKPMA